MRTGRRATSLLEALADDLSWQTKQKHEGQKSVDKTGPANSFEEKLLLLRHDSLKGGGNGQQACSLSGTGSRMSFASLSTAGPAAEANAGRWAWLPRRDT